MKKYSVADVADQYVKYDMIQAHTAIPSYSELRLQLLHAVLNQSTRTQKQSELFALVTALVQLGMDTHDLIDTETEYLSETKMRSRQLKVLAGDYFSARFYHLLAKAGEIQLIGKLSYAVANVNRLKIAFYENAKKATLLAEDYLQERIHIKSELFKQFTDYIDHTLQPVWRNLLQLITQFEIVYEELEQTKDAGGYAKSYAYWFIQEQMSIKDLSIISDEKFNVLIEQYGIKAKLIDKLDTTMHLIQSCVQEHHALHQQLDYLLEQLNIKLSKYVVKRVEAN